MPRPAYQNTFRPNTEIGAGLANLTAALFPSRATAQELAEAEAKRALYASSTEENLVNAQKLGQEAKSLQYQNDGLAQITDPYTLAGALRSNAAQMQDARNGEMMNEIIANAAVENDPVRQGQQLEFLRRLKFAEGGKDRFSMNANNVTLDQFGGVVGNEGNELNQAEIKYGNLGTEVGKSKINVDNSAIRENDSTVRLNNAKVGTESAQADKIRKDAKSAGTGALVETFLGYNPDGTARYGYVAKDVNAVVTKPAPKATDKTYSVTLKDTENLGKAVDRLFGVIDGEAKPTGQAPIDPALRQSIVDRAVQLTAQSGNQPMSLSQAVKELTGGQQLVEEGSGEFLGFIGDDTRVRKLPPKTVAPAKPAAKPAGKPQPKTAQPVPPDVQQLLDMYGAI